MNQRFLGLGLVLLMFSLGIELLPNVFNIGSIVGVAIFLIAVGLVEKEEKKK